MTPTQQGLLVLIVTLAVLLSGAPVAFGLGAISIVFIVIFQGFDALHVVAETFYAGSDVRHDGRRHRLLARGQGPLRSA